MTVQPGWYTDPADPSTQRWWDGEGWVGAPLPADATPPTGPPPPEPEAVVPTAPGPGAGPPVGHPPAFGSPAAPGSPATPAGGWPPPPGHPTPPPGGFGPPPQWGGPLPPGQVPPGWPHPANLYGYPAPRPHGMALAPLGPRLVARLIDIGVVLLLNVVVNGWFVWRWVQEVAPTYRALVRAPGTPYNELPQPGAQAQALEVAILLIAVALWFAYEVPATRNNGQTLGKRLMGIKVVALGEQEQLSFGQAMRRWNTLGLPVFLWYCCLLGLLLQLIDCAFPLFDRPLRQALHDKRALTVVVRVPPTPANPPATRSTDRARTPGGPA